MKPNTRSLFTRTAISAGIFISASLTTSQVQAGFQGTYIDILQGSTMLASQVLVGAGIEYQDPWLRAGVPRMTIDVSDKNVRVNFWTVPVTPEEALQGWSAISSNGDGSPPITIRSSYPGLPGIDQISSISSFNSAFVNGVTNDAYPFFGGDRIAKVDSYTISMDLSNLSWSGYDIYNRRPYIEAGVNFLTNGPFLPTEITEKQYVDFYRLWGNSYVFKFTVDGNTRYYIDPEMAIGYRYDIGSIYDPRITSAILPTGVGDDIYQISYTDYWGDPISDSVRGGDTYLFRGSYFGPDKPWAVSSFMVTGIEPEAGLDPNDPNAFVTGLTFDANIAEASVSMTPLLGYVSDVVNPPPDVVTPPPVDQTVPEPESLALVGLGLAGLSLVSRRRKQAQA